MLKIMKLTKFLARCMECRRALHGMQTRSSDENSVCLFVSVCPCVKRVDGDKTEERSVQIFIP